MASEKRKKDVEVKISAEEGQALLRVASSFGLPEKLGDGQPYNVADRALAAKDAQLLYRELKARSPLLAKERRLCFGPMSNWVREDRTEGADRWKMEDFSLSVEVKLSEDALSGAYWSLLLMLHPASPVALAAGSQEEVAWPLATKLRLVNALEKAIGLEKATHKRMDLDPDPEDESEKSGPRLVEEKEDAEKP